MSTTDNGTAQPVGHPQDRHRAFLQSLLSRPSLTFEDSKPLIAAIESAHTPHRPTLPEDVSQHDFDEYLQAANDAISPFDFEIRSAQHQRTKERTYALVNTTSDALTQMATIHSADEIAFVKRVLDAMFVTYNTPRGEVMAVTPMQALKLTRAPSGGGDRRDSGHYSQAAASALTMQQAERVLAAVVAEGWFELSERGFYSLTPRALMELRTWLVATYNDVERAGSDEDDEQDVDARHEKIKFCAACRDIVTVGQRCPNSPCNCRMHSFCVRNKFRAQGGSEVCPICKSDWREAPTVGERAARPGTGAGDSGRRIVNGTNGRRSTGGRHMDREVDNDASDGTDG